MAGFDKYVLEEKLKALGWREALPEEEDPDHGSYQVVPPADLWEQRPKAFHVYEARDLQNLLGRQTIPIE